MRRNLGWTSFRYGLFVILLLVSTGCQQTQSASMQTSDQSGNNADTNAGTNADCVPQGVKEQPVMIDGLLVIGAVETVSLPELGMTVDARIDTGATTSSLDARDVTIFDRDGADWVKFNTLVGGEEKSFEYKVKRFVKIKNKELGDQRRAVIALRVVLGDIEERIEFSLVDRGNFEFQVLIGRNFLKDYAIVDVSKDHLGTSNTSETKPEGLK